MVKYILVSYKYLKAMLPLLLETQENIGNTDYNKKTGTLRNLFFVSPGGLSLFLVNCYSSHFNVALRSIALT